MTERLTALLALAGDPSASRIDRILASEQADDIAESLR